MKQQTAVEWLVEKLNIWQTIADEDTNATLDTVRKLLEQAKQMEKEQLVKVHIDASSHKFEDVAENYYNKIYSK